MATVLTPHWVSQSARAYKSCVKVGKQRTFSSARSAGTATYISVAPISIPAASARITGSIVLLVAPFLLLSLRLMDTPFRRQTTARFAQHGYSSKRDRLKSKTARFLNVTTALSTRIGTRLATGLDSTIARPALAAVVRDRAIITLPVP